MATHEVPVSACPACGHKFECASGPDERPKLGDLSVCIECAIPLRFGLDAQIVALSQAEFEALPVEDQNHLVRISAAIVAIGEGRR